MQSSIYGRARAVLQLEGEYSPSELKAAYRRAVRLAPPDRDPVAFQRVRAAYELLNNPLRGCREWLLSNVPHCAPPLLDASSTSQPTLGLGHAAFELLVRHQNLDELLPAAELDALIDEAAGAPAAGAVLPSVDTQQPADAQPADAQPDGAQGAGAQGADTQRDDAQRDDSRHADPRSGKTR